MLYIYGTCLFCMGVRSAQRAEWVWFYGMKNTPCEPFPWCPGQNQQPAHIAGTGTTGHRVKAKAKAPPPPCLKLFRVNFIKFRYVRGVEPRYSIWAAPKPFQLPALKSGRETTIIPKRMNENQVMYTNENQENLIKKHAFRKITDLFWYRANKM